MRHLLVIYLLLAGACSSGAQAGSPLDEVADASSGAAEPSADDDETADTDGESEEPSDDERAAAAAKVDTALEAAKGRGEADRLAIAQQRNELATVSGEIDARLTAIAGLEGRIDELLGAGKAERDRRRERVDLLANLIATMSPQAAATMLAQMSDAQAQDLLFSVAQSDKRKAAKLIATMPPSRAAAIGQRYLTRDAASAESIAKDAPAAPAMNVPPPPAAEPPAPPPAVAAPAVPSEEAAP